jgi:hypothetical protein
MLNRLRLCFCVSMRVMSASGWYTLQSEIVNADDSSFIDEVKGIQGSIHFIREKPFFIRKVVPRLLGNANDSSWPNLATSHQIHDQGCHTM